MVIKFNLDRFQNFCIISEITCKLENQYANSDGSKCCDNDYAGTDVCTGSEVDCDGSGCKDYPQPPAPSLKPPSSCY